MLCAKAKIIFLQDKRFKVVCTSVEVCYCRSTLLLLEQSSLLNLSFGDSKVDIWGRLLLFSKRSETKPSSDVEVGCFVAKN